MALYLLSSSVDTGTRVFAELEDGKAVTKWRVPPRRETGPIFLSGQYEQLAVIRVEGWLAHWISSSKECLDRLGE
jgi:hypothetical protein